MSRFLMKNSQNLFENHKSDYKNKFKSEYIWVICNGKFEMPNFIKKKNPANYESVSLDFVEIPDLGFSLDKENQLKVWCPIDDLQYVVIWESHPHVTVMVKRECFQVTNNQLKIKGKYATEFKVPIDREETLSDEKILKFQGDIDDGAGGVTVSPSIYTTRKDQEPVKTAAADHEVNPVVDPEEEPMAEPVVDPTVHSELQNTNNQSSSCENTQDRLKQSENQSQPAATDAASQSTSNQLHLTQSVSCENTQNRLLETSNGNHTQGRETDLSYPGGPESQSLYPAGQAPTETENENQSQGAHSDALFGNDQEEFELHEIEEPCNYRIKIFKSEIHIRLNKIIKIFPIVEHNVEDNDIVFASPPKRSDREFAWNGFFKPFGVDHLFEMLEEDLQGFYFIRLEDCLKERQRHLLDAFWSDKSAVPIPNLGYLLIDDRNTCTSGLTGNQN